jgi:hypothetical protein
MLCLPVATASLSRSAYCLCVVQHMSGCLHLSLNVADLTSHPATKCVALQGKGSSCPSVNVTVSTWL